MNTDQQLLKQTVLDLTEQLTLQRDFFLSLDQDTIEVETATQERIETKRSEAITMAEDTLESCASLLTVLESAEALPEDEVLKHRLDLGQMLNEALVFNRMIGVTPLVEVDPISQKSLALLAALYERHRRRHLKFQEFMESPRGTETLNLLHQCMVLGVNLLDARAMVLFGNNGEPLESDMVMTPDGFRQSIADWVVRRLEVFGTQGKIFYRAYQFGELTQDDLLDKITELGSLFAQETAHLDRLEGLQISFGDASGSDSESSQTAD